MAQNLSTLAVGTLVKDTSTLYNGKPILWKIADKNHAGYPSGAVTLITEKIISLKAFDAVESGNSDSNRRSMGNNRYIHSNIRQWMNSTAAAGAWYTAKHSADAPPTNANVSGNYNEYDQEAGFLAGFSSHFVNALLATTHTVGKASVDGGGTETCEDKIFLASCTEVGLSGDHVCGSKLALFTNDNSRVAYPTAECVSKSEYTSSSLTTSKGWYWWLADAYASNSCRVRIVSSDGSLSHSGACNGNNGVRPLCNLSSGILVSDTADSDGAYTIIWNRNPEKPGTISVPTEVRSGENLTVTWGTATDVDNNLSGYILERQYNGGSWEQVYKGLNRTFTEEITVGKTSVAYRVKAYDAAGAESGYLTSETRTVWNNNPPTIDGTNGDIGTQDGPFMQDYTVTDQDEGQTITVTEKLNGVAKRSYTATPGQENSFEVTAEDWPKLMNGQHTLEIIATDNYGGSVTRTYTFTKNETEIEVSLATPLSADSMVSKGIMSVVRQIPEGATFTVEVCNNGNDASPTWEDVTRAVLRGDKFFLSNNTKTAEAWGFNFRVKVNRNGATGDCWVSSVGGNFE